MPIRFRDASTTVTVGGTSQLVFAANSSRRRLIVMNPTDATEALYVNFTSAASTSAAGSISLNPGGSIDLVGQDCTTEAVYVTAATAGHTFAAKEGY